MEHAEALAAASWWTDQMMSQPDHVPGNPAHAPLLNQLADTQPRLLDGDYAMFAAVLRREVNATIDRMAAADRWPEGGVVILSTDYEPTGILSAAVEQADIKGIRLPVKTSMWVRSGQIEVALGYGSEPKTVWEESHG